VGWLGELHPNLGAHLGIGGAVVFEVQAAVATERRLPLCRPPSRFPAVRRDLAVIVSREVPVAALLAEVRRVAIGVLQDAFVFDIYTGPQIADTQKSVAIGLILQDTSRTLTDADADVVLHEALSVLARSFQASLRE
jgi:phenylalanyl-tRNA synthetase beta chain